MSNFGKKYDPNKRILNRLKLESKANLTRMKRESFKQSNRKSSNRKQIKNILDKLCKMRWSYDKGVPTKSKR